MTPLVAVDDWPCDAVAAAIVRSGETVAVHGASTALFALASVTKLLTAAAVLVGVEEGSIDLDEPAFESGATLADLLAHSSGLSPEGQRLDEPGRRRVYSNAGYELAAGALEASARIPFATYLEEAILAPLEMSTTALNGSPAHGAVSTVGDLARFLNGLDRVLAPETISRMTTPHLPELIGVLPGYGRQEPNPWGLGPEIRDGKHPHWTGSSNSESTWGHFGQAGTFMWFDPAADVGLIVLTNRPFGDWALQLWPALADAVLGD